VGLIDDLPEAGDLVRRIAEAAEATLLRSAGHVTGAP
jgi:nitronate monooxygenase